MSLRQLKLFVVATEYLGGCTQINEHAEVAAAVGGGSSGAGGVDSSGGGADSNAGAAGRCAFWREGASKCMCFDDSARNCEP